MKKNKHLDEELFASYRKLPTLPFYQLIRQDPASLKKSQTLFFKNGTEPVFSYGRTMKFDADGYLAKMTEWKSGLTHENELLVDLYRRKADELLDRARIVKAIQTDAREEIAPLSQRLFGQLAYTDKTLEDELAFRKTHPPAIADETDKIDAGEMQSFVEEIIQSYDMKGVSVMIKDVPSFRIKRGRTHHSRLLVPKSFVSSKRRVTELLVHELEVHLLRSENALATPLLLLKQGLDHYLRTEEGLAMYYTRQVEPRGLGRTPGFWNAFAINLAARYPFTETFKRLFEEKRAVLQVSNHADAENHARESAWKLCVRAYRGVINPRTAGPVLTRDHVYLSGYLDIDTFIKTKKEDLPILFAGKMSLEHISVMKALGIAPARTPQLLAKSLVSRAS